MKKAIKPGSIVVMHINKGGKHTAEALPTIIKNIKKKGYRLVTVGTMLKNGGGFPK
jgi:peptidoglycan/xylan/chitin deacetylase (PgdA/CDA1 family)